MNNKVIIKTPYIDYHYPCEPTMSKILFKPGFIISGLIFFSAIFSFSSSSLADEWVDKDRATLVTIGSTEVSIFSLDSFYYFDEIFSNVRDGKFVNICFGFDGKTGSASDCYHDYRPTPSFHNGGKNRALQFKMGANPFLLAAFQDYLKAGKTLKLSIDDGDLFSSYTLNKDYTLNAKALEILALPD